MNTLFEDDRESFFSKLISVFIHFYGVRGSIPTPMRSTEFKEKCLKILREFTKQGHTAKKDLNAFWEELPDSLKYIVGGNSTCIHIQSEAGNHYIIDAGTGARVLGEDLLPKILGNMKEPFPLKYFFTHTHWDHIQGLPFFKPAYFPQSVIDFYSPLEDLEARLSYQMDTRFFPIHFEDTASRKIFHKMEVGTTLEFPDGLKVETHPLKHPGGSYAYKFTENGKSFIFATDAEFTGTDMKYISEITPFFKNAEVLVLDSQYTLDESFGKFDWGHTSYTMAVNCATQWGVKNLFLTHHEPVYTDEKIYSIYTEAKDHRDALHSDHLKIHLAREGIRIQL